MTECNQVHNPEECTKMIVPVRDALEILNGKWKLPIILSLTFGAKRFKQISKDINGITRSVEMDKRVRQWWFVSDNGKVCLNIRYGAKVIELAKGKTAIEVANADELIRTLELVKSAVEGGELDTQIESVSGALREGFIK